MNPTNSKKREGVTSFLARHTTASLDSTRYGPLAGKMAGWRTVLAQLGLTGLDPNRYDGVGYGNISGRIGPFPGQRGRRAFLVSGTQTGALDCVGLEEFALVESYDVARNTVWSRGSVAPSSESMTHGAVYDLAPHIRFVFHAHAPQIWREASTLGIPMTGQAIEYGTPEMAREVARLARESKLWETQLFGMAGHEDGVVSFGRTADEAGHRLMSVLAQGYALVYGENKRVCIP